MRQFPIALSLHLAVKREVSKVGLRDDVELVARVPVSLTKKTQGRNSQRQRLAQGGVGLFAALIGLHRKESGIRENHRAARPVKKTAQERVDLAAIDLIIWRVSTMLTHIVCAPKLTTIE
jgi:hypothetical protein